MTKHEDFPNDLSDRVYLITGGTGGLGSEVVAELAKRGARIILLCRNSHEPKNIALVATLKRRFQNNHIYAVSCDLHSEEAVNTFIWNWHRTNEPRRLDAIICCATHSKRIILHFSRSLEKDVVKVNYLLQRYLVNGLCATLLLQPSHRDVRIIITTNSVCRNYPNKPGDHINKFLGLRYGWDLWVSYKRIFRKCSSCSYWQAFFVSQMLFGVYGRLLQRQLNAKKHSDGSRSRIKVGIVDPGFIRNKSLRNFWSNYGEEPQSKVRQLQFQMITRSCCLGAKSIIHALFSLALEATKGASHIQNCQVSRTYYCKDYLKNLDKRNFSYKYSPRQQWMYYDQIVHIPNFEQ